MKKFFSLFVLLLSLKLSAQTKQDTIDLLIRTATLYDLGFTQAEADSMIDGIKENAAIFNNMHKLSIPNELTYPFAFNPAPIGFTIPKVQQKINWNIPTNVAMPKNKADLAFYSITQLASLIKSKKITSVELTTFFLDRLKKHNDTLRCVISFTDDIAMQQAKKADDEIKRGVYRGPLHGIP